MPNETLIAEIENMLSEVVRLGGENERTQIVPNLTVQDANPANLSGFIIVSDDRDGDNILAKKVPSVVYSDNDLVNVMFVKGGEAVAFQQGSQSSSSGIWGIITGTSTDIFYNSGDVSVGKTSAPDARLELVDTAQAQLRLTHTDATKFADFTLDTNHDLTIKPSSTGQIKLQPTTDNSDFFQVLDADGGTPIINVNSVNETMSIGTTSSTVVVQGSTITADLFIQGDNTAAVRTALFSRFSDTASRGASNSFIRASAAEGAVADTYHIGKLFFEAHDGTDYNRSAEWRVEVDGSVSANTVPMAIIFSTSETNFVGMTDRLTIASDGLITVSDDFMLAGGSQNYLVSNRVTNMTISGQSGGSNASVELFSNDGDGTDIVGINIYGVGTDASITNRERLQVRYNSSQLFEIFTEANGTGTLRELVLYTEGNTNQLHLDTSGNVGLSVAPSTRLDVGSGAVEFEEMSAPAAGAANTARLYAEDDGGTTRQQVKFSSGNAVTIAKDGGLATYTPTNVVTDRSYDANATSVAELADVLGTLIADFQAAGVLG